MKLTMLVVALTALLSTPALSVDLSSTFRGEDGHTAIPDELELNNKERCGEALNHPCLTLGRAIFHALVRPYSDEGGLSGEEKFKRGDLAYRVFDKKNAALSPQDVILCKLVIGKLYTPLIIRQAYIMLDPSMAPPPEPAPK